MTAKSFKSKPLLMKILINSIRNILSRERTIISNIYLNIFNANILTRLISSRFYLTGTSTVQLLSSLSLRPHGLQHTRLLCPPLSPVVYSNSWPLSWPYYLTIPFSAPPRFSFLSSILPSIQVFFKWDLMKLKDTYSLEGKLWPT